MSVMTQTWGQHAKLPKHMWIMSAVCEEGESLHLIYGLVCTICFTLSLNWFKRTSGVFTGRYVNTPAFLSYFSLTPGLDGETGWSRKLAMEENNYRHLTLCWGLFEMLCVKPVATLPAAPGYWMERTEGCVYSLHLQPVRLKSQMPESFHQIDPFLFPSHKARQLWDCMCTHQKLLKKNVRHRRRVCVCVCMCVHMPLKG